MRAFVCAKAAVYLMLKLIDYYIVCVTATGLPARCQCTRVCFVCRVGMESFALGQIRIMNNWGNHSEGL